MRLDKSAKVDRSMLERHRDKVAVPVRAPLDHGEWKEQGSGHEPPGQKVLRGSVPGQTPPGCGVSSRESGPEARVVCEMPSGVSGCVYGCLREVAGVKISRTGR